MKISNQKIFVGTLATLIIIIFLFQQPQLTSTEFTPDRCDDVSFSIESIDCSNSIFEIKLKNMGDVDLDGSFLAVVTTNEMFAYIANDVEIPISPNEAGNLIMDAEDLEGIVRRMQISFQECPDVQQIKEELNLVCR